MSREDRRGLVPIVKDMKRIMVTAAVIGRERRERKVVVGGLGVMTSEIEGEIENAG